jgi:hypothetical protein
VVGKRVIRDEPQLRDSSRVFAGVVRRCVCGGLGARRGVESRSILYRYFGDARCVLHRPAMLERVVEHALGVVGVYLVLVLAVGASLGKIITADSCSTGITLSGGIGVLGSSGMPSIVTFACCA